MAESISAAGPSSTDRGFFGHPAGLSTLFFTEMWERMSYYGMRALLVLFMTASLQEGGLALSVASATAIYGLYTGAVYFTGLPGGWIADHMLGGQRAVWYGGIIIMCGHIVLAIPRELSFFPGLILVVLGTGLLKPNITALVGGLYDIGDARRDSGYTLYYMGINIGSIIGYSVCGWLAVSQGWHWGFGAAAVGMALGLIQYRLTLPRLRGVSAEPAAPLSERGQRRGWLIVALLLAALGLLAVLMLAGVLVFDPVVLARYSLVLITVIFLVYYGAIFFLGRLSTAERKRLGALFLICVASCFFWAGFEQAGSSLNLFARDFTDRLVGGFEIPAPWFQNANPIFIIVLAPFFAALWVQLGKRMMDPSYGVKSALGLIIMGSGFLVMFFAAQIAASGLEVAPWWLISTYFLHTVGELSLSPVALSAVSRLSPRRFMGQMMGVFVLTYAIGSVLAGLLAGNMDPENLQQMPDLFLHIALLSMGVGALVFLISLKTRDWERAQPASTEGEKP